MDTQARDETAGHTPTPWFLINDCCVGGPIEPGWEAAGCGVAHFGMRARTQEEAAANAALVVKAVNEYASLKAENERLRVALEPFAALGAVVDTDGDIPPRLSPKMMGALRNARAALSKAEGAE